MNPYETPASFRPIHITPAERKAYILNHPDARPLAKIYAKYPARFWLTIFGVIAPLIAVGLYHLLKW